MLRPVATASGASTSGAAPTTSDPQLPTTCWPASAAAVAQYLQARHPHLAGAEVNVDGRGVCCYATENDTPEGRARNRRVEISFWRVPSDL
jgi:hypothetical protein